MEQRRLPFFFLRPEDEGPAYFVVGELVREEHVLDDDVDGILCHQRALLRRRRQELRPQRVVHASRRPEVGDARRAAHARAGQDDDVLAGVGGQEARDAGEVLAREARHGAGARGQRCDDEVVVVARL